jgi:hypothetical protein
VEAYLRLDIPGFKVIARPSQYRGIVISVGAFGLAASQGTPIDQREGYLKLLETISHNNGNSIKLKYHSRDAEVVEILPPIPQKFLAAFGDSGTVPTVPLEPWYGTGPPRRWNETGPPCRWLELFHWNRGRRGGGGGWYSQIACCQVENPEIIHLSQLALNSLPVNC